MIRSFRAEWRKLRQRPAVIVLTVLLALGVILTLYVIPHFEMAQPDFHDKSTGAGSDILRLGLYPAAFVKNAVQAMMPDGALLAILIGTLGLGSEYGWGTLKAVFVQGQGRLVPFTGRVVATSAVLAMVVVISFAAAAGASAVTAALDKETLTTWPTWTEIAKVLAASWLVLMCYAATGMALAAALRNAALAIGAGIFYMVIFESSVIGLLTPLWPALMNKVEQFVPGLNASSLLVSFGPPPGQRFPAAIVGPEHSVLILALWVVAQFAATAILIWRHDVS